MPYMIGALIFVVGFVLGTVFSYFGVFNIFPNHKVKDELTRSKRELANARRALDEFFKTSADLFAQLDKNYKNYAYYMKEAAEKLSSEGGDAFLIPADLEISDNLKDLLQEAEEEKNTAEAEKSKTPAQENKPAESTSAADENPGEPTLPEKSEESPAAYKDGKEEIEVTDVLTDTDKAVNFHKQHEPLPELKETSTVEKLEKLAKEEKAAAESKGVKVTDAVESLKADEASDKEKI